MMFGGGTPFVLNDRLRPRFRDGRQSKLKMSGSRAPRSNAAAPAAKRSVDAGHVGAGRDFLIVGIGASADGLEPCKKLVAALPACVGMAFILIQHPDPTHETMMVELLAKHTSLTVQLAENLMPLEREHFYVVPPGTYLSVADDVLHLTPRQKMRGAPRLPLDHLLRSMAENCGRRAVCIVLSGGGNDDSLGLRAIKDRGGLVLVQDPDEASHHSTPHAAILTGAVDSVLPLAAIPAALNAYARDVQLKPPSPVWPRQDGPPRDRFPEILELLRANTAQDFSLYKQGTLERRVERRMALTGIKARDLEHYLHLLRSDPKEVGLLAKDVLIHVTSFFRDADIFELLSRTILPDLIRNAPADRPLRVWIAGCSTGEETYSLAMLLHEQVALTDPAKKLQIFASDVDDRAIAHARAGFYPSSVAPDISPERLARFFTREGEGFRVSPDLRASIVFSVHDVLADPPLSRIDLASCRNLLIYLGPEAQKKIVSVFHFALREGGILLLGNAETIGKPDGRFDAVAERERLYRRTGGKRIPDLVFPSRGERPETQVQASSKKIIGSRVTLGDLCTSLLMKTYAPAAVIADCENHCLFLSGLTDDYLRAAQGNAILDVLAMARDGVRTILSSAILRARSRQERVVVTGGRMMRNGVARSFSVAAQPVPDGADGLLLICFLDEANVGPQRDKSSWQSTSTIDLENELHSVRAELEAAKSSHGIFREEQSAVNEEALSINEECQSTNEELISSKEELQSLNEELHALNGQLQETLERQRTASNDLQNVLYSTDVATLFLDVDLRIRFFTPAIKPLFNIIQSDIGRPLSDLRSQALDDALMADARAVLRGQAPIEREIGSPDGVWFSRRTLPYRTKGNQIEGIVITYADATERKHAAKALEQAKQAAERANAAKSRFLAAASHDLRQPLQTLTLLQSLLQKTIDGKPEKALLVRSGEALAAMSSMLNTLLDINQIEAGAVSTEIVSFPIDQLLDALREEYRYQAEAQGLELRVSPCGLSIDTDPRLLGQMVRNLLSNALKYTRRGKVLLGCRRRPGTLSLEVWDTGIGIAGKDLHAIFEEYRQVENRARVRTQGLGLGLSIVQRLGDLLGHRVHVRSQRGKGSVFAIDVELTSSGTKPILAPQRALIEHRTAHDRLGNVLIVEDDVEVRDLLRLYLEGEGHHTAAVGDGTAALDLVIRRVIVPDLILADYNLPGGMDGLEVATKVREILHRNVPAVVLTGDISSKAVRAVGQRDCVRLNKPVRTEDLTRVIQSLLPPLTSERPAARRVSPTADATRPVIFVIDDDDRMREALRDLLEAEGRTVIDYASCEAFLEAVHAGADGCLLVDAHLPGMGGIDLLERLGELDWHLPAIMITGSGDVPVAVRAMKAGAFDFIEKPIGAAELCASVNRALEQARDKSKLYAAQQDAAGHLASLTSRQRQIMTLVLAGHPSKNIASDLGISQRTVENHRATIMKRTGSKSVPALARLSYIAAEPAPVSILVHRPTNQRVD